MFSTFSGWYHAGDGAKMESPSQVREMQDTCANHHSRIGTAIPNQAGALDGQKAKQQHYYKGQAQHIPPIPTGDGVRMQLAGPKTWTLGVFTELRGPRSYRVRVGEQEFPRNSYIHERRHFPT